MARPTLKKKSPLSQAIVDIRAKLGESQQAFANRLGMALQTVARWETQGPPSGYILVRLEQIARQADLPAAANVFSSAVEDELERVGLRSTDPESKVCPKCNSLFWQKPREMKWAIDKAKAKAK